MRGGGWVTTRTRGHRTGTRNVGLDFPPGSPTKRLVRGALPRNSFTVLRRSPVAKIVECGPLFALAILQQGENESSHQYLMKGSETVAKPLSGQVEARRIRTKRERMTLVTPPGAGP